MEIERSFGEFGLIFASDECGRGPLAGPVVACTISVPDQELDLFLKVLENIGVKDSKKLSSKKIKEIISILGLNEKLKNPSFQKRKLNFSNFKFLEGYIVALSNIYIDEKNILRASLDAMKLGFMEIYKKNNSPEKILWLIDGPHAPKGQIFTNKNFRTEPIIKGDSKSKLIALASIVAKYYRDQMMNFYSEKYPDYHLEKNKGYPTKEHYDAIKKFGPTEIHRRSFRGVC